MALIIPKCNAESNTLRYTLQVYAEANDWVSNADLIDKLSNRLIEVGIESEKKEPQSYTKKTQVLSYYGLIEWEDPENNQSRRKITSFGQRLYKYLLEDNKNEIQKLLIEVLETKTFGRNVLGCDSDSDLEAPNIFIKSTLILGNLSNKEFAYILGRMENDNIDYSDVLFEVLINRKQGILVAPDGRAAKWADPKPILALADWGIFTTHKEGASKLYYLDGDLINNYGGKLAQLKIKNTDTRKYIKPVDESIDIADNSFNNYHTSIRTKPFLLFAGISGTGKSRIVKQMAFDTCQNIDDLQKDKTSPGNYQLIEVKPNWHDSTEVLGYESEIGGKHYVVTPFVKFLVKAMLYEDKVPFFVCMDEMNLAPVEQYFAEFLSVLESRKLIDGRITSEALIPADVFKDYEYKGLKAELSGQTKENPKGYDGANLTEDEEEYGNFNIIYDRLKKDGLRIPSNLIVVGTVNMDETTHQFSRKVIDRAMTIEMNIADGTEPFADFFENDAELDYRTEPLDKDLFLSKVVQAKEALDLLETEDVEYLKANIPNLLSNLNESLNGTPFKIAYRVQNELVIYFFELRRENKEATAEELLTQAMDAILMQKVLPRVEGDEDLLEKPLEKLHTFTQNYENAHAKVEEMQTRLNAHFTSFWP